MKTPGEQRKKKGMAKVLNLKSYSFFLLFSSVLFCAAPLSRTSHRELLTD